MLHDDSDFRLPFLQLLAAVAALMWTCTDASLTASYANDRRGMANKACSCRFLQYA